MRDFPSASEHGTGECGQLKCPHHVDTGFRLTTAEVSSVKKKGEKKKHPLGSHFAVTPQDGCTARQEKSLLLQFQSYIC